MKNEQEVKKYLGFEKFTRPNEDLKKLAKKLLDERAENTVNNILNWIEKNIKGVNLEEEDYKKWKKTFACRKVSEIFREKTAYGCTNFTQLFCVLLRLCGIPAKFVVGKRIKASGTHVWARVHVIKGWVDIDPSQGLRGWNFNPDQGLPGPYTVISESLGPSDSAHPSYEAWRQLEQKWDYTKGKFRT